MKKILLHLLLFVLTFVATTLAGAEWTYASSFFYVKEPMGWTEFVGGLRYSIPFLFILTCHEFGHYFVARAWKMAVSLPYYIPVWGGFLLAPTIGTMGAFIKIKTPFRSRKEVFDVGVAGPLAGFVPAVLLIWYGFTHLPPADYVFAIHPEYMEHGANYAQHVYENKEGLFAIGNNLIFWFFENYVADPALVPNHYETIHYPYLFAGYLALFFTALNLLPIGQLDGGHIVFSMLGGQKHSVVALGFYILFIVYAGLGLPVLFTPEEPEWQTALYNILYVGFLYICFYAIKSKPNRLMIVLLIFALQYTLAIFVPSLTGYPGWLVFGFLLGRILGIFHPPVPDNKPLGKARVITGWLAIIIFVLSFSPKPFVFF